MGLVKVGVSKVEGRRGGRKEGRMERKEGKKKRLQRHKFGEKVCRVEEINGIGWK